MVRQVLEESNSTMEVVTRSQVTKEAILWRSVKKTSKERTDGVWCWDMTYGEWATSPLVRRNEEMESKYRMHSVLQ